MGDFSSRFPVSAESVALFRDLFGEGVKVEAVVEGGDCVVTAAKRAEAGMKVDVGGEQWLRLGRLIKMEQQLQVKRGKR